MKKIAILFLIITVLFITGCGKEELQNETNVPINNEENQDLKDYTIITNSYDLDMATDITNIKKINNLIEFIAIIEITNIDGVTNWNELTKNYVKPFTYGKMNIVKSIKGNISGSVEFKRLGGTMLYSEYIKGDPAPEKIEALRDKSAPIDKLLVREVKENDIDVEENKIYLVFMNQYDFNRKGMYTLEAFEYGLLELENQNLTTETINNNIQDIKVKNNITKTYESITNFVDFSTIK